MLVQVYLVELKFDPKGFILIREDDAVASYRYIVQPNFDIPVEYIHVSDFNGLFFASDKSITLLDTIPEEEVLDYIKFYEVMDEGEMI